MCRLCPLQVFFTSSSVCLCVYVCIYMCVLFVQRAHCQRHSLASTFLLCTRSILKAETTKTTKNNNNKSENNHKQQQKWAGNVNNKKLLHISLHRSGAAKQAYPCWSLAMLVLASLPRTECIAMGARLWVHRVNPQSPPHQLCTNLLTTTQCWAAAAYSLRVA